MRAQTKTHTTEDLKMKEIRVRAIEDVMDFRDLYEVTVLVDGKVQAREVFFTESQADEFIRAQG